MAQGLNRDAVLIGFMFSAEFQAFMDGILGVTPQRQEVALVMDDYRAAFGRLPDSGGFTYWRGTLRSAQCQGAAAVNAAANNLITTFFTSQEYANRLRSNRQFVADLYDVFFRRAPDVGGFNYWTGQVDGGHLTKEQLIGVFFGSGEWGSRLNAIAAEPCVP